jgi:hypothetical protein
MAKLNKTYNFLIRSVILLLTFYYLYQQLFLKHNFSTFTDNFHRFISYKGFWLYLFLVVLLIPLNLLLETYKWKLLMAKMEAISLLQAVKGVLAGISVSMFMPNRVGDYLGRVFILKKADRVQATLATILGSAAQLITTLLFGTIALVIFLPHWLDLSFSINQWAYLGIIIGAFLIMLFVVFAYLNFSTFTLIIQRLSGRAYKRIAHYAEVFSWYQAGELFYMLIISIFRYLIFSFQFYLLLKMFQIHIDYFHAMVLIGLVYFIMTIIPTIALSEIGVRGSVSLYVFSLYFEGQTLSETFNQQIVTASSVLWLFNLAIPAVLGVVFIFKMNFFRKNT